MNARAPTLAFLAAAMLAVSAAVLLVRLVPSDVGVEIGRERGSELSPRLVDALGTIDGELVVTWFGAEESDLPAGWRDVPARVRGFLAELEAHGRGRVRTLVLEPGHDADAARYASRLGLTPISARTIESDGWSEVDVWSTLRIVDGTRGAALVPGLSPEMLPALSELVLAHLEALRSPPRPKIAIAAPDRFATLRSVLGAEASVADVDFETSAEIAPDVDLFVWLEPRVVRAEHVRALTRYIERGGSVWIGSAPNAVRSVSVDGAPALEREAKAGAQTAAGSMQGDGADPLGALFAHFGLRRAPGVVLDARGKDGADPSKLALRVASIGEHQDFRELAREPGGTLYFEAPSGLVPEPERQAELGLRTRLLACSSPASWRIDLPSGVTRLDALPALPHSRATAALLVELVPADPWRGSLVVAASTSPFQDVDLADSVGPARGLVDALREELASTSRTVRHALARARPAPLPEFDANRRLFARLGASLVPAALVALGALVLAGRHRRRSARARRTIVAAWTLAFVTCAVAAAASAFVPAVWSADWTREHAHALPGELADLARGPIPDSGDRVRVVSAFSPDADLPPELVTLARGVRERVRDLARQGPLLALRELRPSASDVAGAAAGDEWVVDEGRLPILRVTSRLDETTHVRRIFASVSFERGGRVARVDFEDERAFESADFRLGFALWRVLSGREPTIAFAAGEARLSPAESLLEFERQGRFAPRPGARFQIARAALEHAGFRIVDVDPERPVWPAQVDLAVWLAPRRDVRPLGTLFARFLAHGGKGFVALQPFRLRPTRHAEREGGLTLWPEPQFADLDQEYLPRLGLDIPRELLLDTRTARAPLSVKVEEQGAHARLVREEVGGALVVRAARDPRVDPWGTGPVRGDLVLPAPARIEFDAVTLARRGLDVVTLVRASSAAWKLAWHGGDIPARELSPPEDSTRSVAEAAVVVLVRGSFPGPEVEPAWPVDPSEIAAAARGSASLAPGELVVCASSEAFENELLAEQPENERFLVATAAAASLPREIASLANRRVAVAGLDPLPTAERVRWRVAIAAGAPLGMLLIGLLIAWWRRRAPNVFAHAVRDARATHGGGA